MDSYFSTLTRKSLIVKSFQQLIYDITSTAVQDNFISNKVHNLAG